MRPRQILESNKESKYDSNYKSKRQFVEPASDLGISSSEPAKLTFTRAGPARMDGTIKICDDLAVRSGRVAQLAEQLTLNQ
jgi:hypothetical protein